MRQVTAEIAVDPRLQAERMITKKDPEWPANFADMDPLDPPQQLYLRGQRLVTAEKTIAIVGARRPTIAGIEAAEMFARGLVECGFTIVSGLAVGIDATAHRAALEAGGYTIAVLGSGLDLCYPKQNLALKRHIAGSGTLVTEYPDGTQPLAGHFPRRNRIIAGLTKGVIFVEGTTRSGGLITARNALDANRDVFAVPGSYRNTMATGPNELIRTSQAALVSKVEDVLQCLAGQLAWSERFEPSVSSQDVSLEDDDARILFLLDDVPASADRLCNASGFAFGRVALSLSKLEVRGLAVRHSSGYAITSAGARIRRALLQEEDR